MEQALKVDVVFRDEDAEQVAAAMVDVGGQDVKTVEQKGFTGVEIVVLGLLAAGGVVNLVIRLQQLWSCGVLVDARGQRITTKRDCSLPRGSCLVLAPDGTKSTLHQPSQLELKELLDAALAGAG